MALLLLVGACGPINTIAYRPKPNVIANRVHLGTVQVDVSQVPEGVHCAHTEGIRDVCVDKFRNAYGYGLQQLTYAFFSGSGPRYVARFKMVEFSHTPAAVTAKGGVVAIRVQMRWQFTLTDESGQNVVAIANTTEGPKPAAHPDEVGAMVEALMNATLEEIAAELNRFTPEEQAKEEPSEDEPGKDEPSEDEPAEDE